MLSGFAENKWCVLFVGVVNCCIRSKTVGAGKKSQMLKVRLPLLLAAMLATPSFSESGDAQQM